LAPRSRLSLTSLIIWAAVLTSPWTGVKVAGLNVCDLLIVLAFVPLTLDALARKRVVLLRWWMFMPTLGALFILGIDVIIRNLSLGQQLESSGNVSGSTAAGDTGGGAIFVARIALATLAIAILVASEVATYGSQRGVTLLRAWTLGISVSAFATITDTYGLTNVAEYTFHQVSDFRAFGLAFHPNSLAQTIALGLPLMLLFAVRSERLILKLFWIAGIIAGLSSLLLANSRGGLAVGFIGLIVSVLLLIQRTKARRWGPPLILLAAIPLYFAATWLVDNTRLGGSGGANLSDVGRSAYIDQGLKLFSESPIVGVGLGLGSGVSVPVLVMSSGGILFLLFYYLFIFVGWKDLFLNAKDLFYALCFVSVTALIVIGFLNNSVNERYDFVVVAVCAAMIASVPKEGDRVTPLRTWAPR